MSHGRPHPPEKIEVSIEPTDGWHCTHMYYRFDRAMLGAMEPEDIQEGRDDVIATLDPVGVDAPARLQTSVVSGHKADFSLMLMDSNPLKIESINQRLLGGKLGAAIVPTYSFVSMTEVSEYVPSVEQYSARLVADGDDENGPAYKAKVKAYQDREPMMRKQRLTPDFPAWPSTCFYPMNKKRKVGENWFMMPFADRNKLMAEHARSGMAFAGKASQLITVGLGLDDWEWGVTLWGANPQYLKDIVYKMRFDEASARYAEFGQFFMSYIMSPTEMLNYCQIGL